MPYYLAIILSIILCRFLFLAYRYQQRYQQTKPIRCAHQLFNQLYANVDGKLLAKQECERLQWQGDSFVYGEITLSAFAAILERIPIRPGEIFYDLGCGAGKAVMAAAMLRTWKKCCGVEILPALIDCCQAIKLTALQRIGETHPFYEQLKAVDFLKQDLLETDFSDADVVFLHATTFHPSLWEPLKIKLNQLKQHASVIVATKKLSHEQFDIVDAIVVPMTWGECSVFIYQKR